MAMQRLGLPRDQRATMAAMGALVVVAAIIIFLMIALVHNVGAY